MKWHGDCPSWIEEGSDEKDDGRKKQARMRDTTRNDLGRRWSIVNGGVGSEDQMDQIKREG